MIKEEEEQKKKRMWIANIVVAILGGILSVSEFELEWYYGIGIAIGIFLLLTILKKLGILKVSITKKKEEIDFTNIPLEQVKETVKNNEEYNKQAEKYISKNDDSIYAEIAGNFTDIIFNSIALIILSIFYFGALPIYFGVNNEFLNPTNSSLGVKAALELSQETIYNALFVRLMGMGASSPTFWFWFWWVAVFMLFVYPLISIGIAIIKKIIKKRKRDKNGSLLSRRN